MQKNKKKIKRIGIDARFYGPLGKGLGRYTQEVVDNVIAMDKENEYIIFLSQDNFEEFRANERVKKVLAPVRWYTLAEQILMPFYIWREKLDLIHFPHFNVPIFTPIKFVVTVHDLILTKFSTVRATTLSPFFYKIKNFSYKIVIWLAVKRAQIVITVSQFTKDDIISQFKVSPQKVRVTYEGVASFQPEKTEKNICDDKKVLLGYNIRDPFLLYVGNAYPHKNLEGLVSVFYSLHKKNKNLSLVLVGKKDYFYSRVEEFTKKYWIKNSPIVFPGFVPDEKLAILFRNALTYVFPSFYEGFGLPPIEAMAHGCPVVSSDKSSLPEILGEAAVYFNPEDKEEMFNCIEEIMNDEKLRLSLIEKGYKQIKNYSWKKCAVETLAIYKMVLK
jgi:hypothetical protein